MKKCKTCKDYFNYINGEEFIDFKFCIICNELLCTKCPDACNKCGIDKTRCSNCQTIYTNKLEICQMCKLDTCQKCIDTCKICTNKVCTGCSLLCKSCNHKICGECESYMEEICNDCKTNKNICSSCGKESTKKLKRCIVCEDVCEECFHKCSICNDGCCNYCNSSCESCKRIVCDNCIHIDKNKNLRCKLCKK